MLGLTAPRALMVVNATKDAIQFSVGEAKKSLALAAPVFKLLGKPDNLRHAIFESPHDYSQGDARGDVRLHDTASQGRRATATRSQNRKSRPRTPKTSAATPATRDRRTS